MKSRELVRATEELRDLVGRVRLRAGAPGRRPDISPELRRLVARSAREVLAWGAELRSPCALAAAEEALQVLDRMQPASTAPAGDPAGWACKAAVICLHVGHSPHTDSGGLADRLKHATLERVLDRPPFPMHARVSPLSVDDEALRGWAKGHIAAHDPVGTLAPLLVSILYPVRTVDSDAVIAHLTAATSLDGYAERLPAGARAYRIILPVAGHLLQSIQKRCLGGSMCGRYGI